MRGASCGVGGACVRWESGAGLWGPLLHARGGAMLGTLPLGAARGLGCAATKTAGLGLRIDHPQPTPTNLAQPQPPPINFPKARVHKSEGEVEVLRYVNKIGSRAHVAMMEVGGLWWTGAAVTEGGGLDFASWGKRGAALPLPPCWGEGAGTAQTPLMEDRQANSSEPPAPPPKPPRKPPDRPSRQVRVPA